MDSSLSSTVAVTGDLLEAAADHAKPTRTQSSGKEQLNTASALLLKSSMILPDVAEPEVNRGDDPDGCLQFTINAMSGERQAPPKTEDGTDTEEVDTTLSMVYVRVHTTGGGGSLMSNVSVKTAGQHTPVASTTPRRAEGAAAGGAADGWKQHAESQASGQEVAAGACADAAESTNCSGSGWDEVYKDVLQRIYSCRLSATEHNSLADSQQQSGSLPSDPRQQQQQQRKSSEDATDSVLDMQAARMAAHALASACTEPCAGPDSSAAQDSVSARVSASSASEPSTSGGSGLGADDSSSPAAADPAPASVSSTATATHTQESSSSGHKTPVMLPPDAADLPVQAVLDELDTLLARSELRSSAQQLRTSRQATTSSQQQHTGATPPPRRTDSGTLLPDSLTQAAALGAASPPSSILHSREVEEAVFGDADGGGIGSGDCGGGSSRRPSSHQDAAADRGEPADAFTAHSSSNNSSSSRRVDLGDRLNHADLESKEARDEIRQHLQMMVGDKQEGSADRRDASTSVGGLVNPGQEQPPHQQQQQHQLPASGLSHSSSPAPAASTASPSGPAAAGSGGSQQGRGSDEDVALSGAVTRRSSSSRCSEICNSTDKLHALYARYTAEHARRSSTGEGGQQGSSSAGRAARRTGGILSTSVTSLGQVAAPVRSSMPYPLAAMTGAAKQTQGAGSAAAVSARRCRSVSPCKEAGRSLVLDRGTLQQHQEQQQQQQQCQEHHHGYPHQLQHSMSLCSSCGGPLHARGVSGLSRAESAAAPTATNTTALTTQHTAVGASTYTVTATSAYPAGGAGAVGDAAAMGSRPISDARPATHISISGLMAAGGLVGASVAQWEEQPTAQRSVSPGGTPGRSSGGASAADGSVRSRSAMRNGAVSNSVTELQSSPSPVHKRSGGGRGGAASPVRGSGSGRGYSDFVGSPQYSNRTSPAATYPGRRAASSSPVRRRPAGLATEPAVVGVTQISFGQLLQETAMQQAFGKIEEDAGGITPQHSAAQDGSAVLQTLKTVPEDGVVDVASGGGHGSGTQQAQLSTQSKAGSRRQLLLPSQLEQPPPQQLAVVTVPSPTAAAAAAAALQELAKATARTASEAQETSQLLSHSSSLHRSGSLGAGSISRRASLATDRRCMTTSSSMRSHTSTLSTSSSSSRAWRPGGNRTDPRDDYRKLQTYESARLRALQKQGLLSPGASARCMSLATDSIISPHSGFGGCISPKSGSVRCSISQDQQQVATSPPVSPGQVGMAGGNSAPATPTGAGSRCGYAAASARRRPGAVSASPHTPAAASPASPTSAARRGRTTARPASAPPAKAAGLSPTRSAGRGRAEQTGHSAFSAAATSTRAEAAPPSPKRCTSPKLTQHKKKEQQQQQGPAHQDMWQALTGQPCPPGLVPVLQRMQQQQQSPHGGGGLSGRASSKGLSPSLHAPASSCTFSSKGTAGPLPSRNPLALSAASRGNSTTAQVEEAIRAAQAALLHKQQQVSQFRQAISSSWAPGGPSSSRARGRAAALQAASTAAVVADADAAPDASAGMAADGVPADSCIGTSVWGDSSCTSSYTGSVAAAHMLGKRSSRELATGSSVGREGAASQQEDSNSVVVSPSQAPTPAAAGVGPNTALVGVSRPGSSSADGYIPHDAASARSSSRGAVGLATVSAPVGVSSTASEAAAGQAAAAAAAALPAPRAAARASVDEQVVQQPAAPAAAAVVCPVRSPFQQSAGAPYAVTTVQASRGGSSNTAALRSSPTPATQAAVSGSRYYQAPVTFPGRSRSRSPSKRRPVSALEALLRVAPMAAEVPQPVRPSSAEPVMVMAQRQQAAGSSSSSHSPGSVGAMPRAHSRNAAASVATATASTSPGTRGLGHGVSVSKARASNASARRSSCEGSVSSSYGAEPWSAPHQRSAAGLTGEQLLALHRRRSQQEAAEAAALAAAAAGDSAGEGAAEVSLENPLQLDVMVRAYTALNKKNKNSSERAAAVAMLLDRITEGSHHSTSQGTSPRSSPRTNMAGDSSTAATSPAAAAAGGDGSGGEGREQKLRSSPMPCLDVLGRGLGAPDSPSGGAGGGVGVGGGPSSPSTIIQTLKADSLSSWHRVSPERQQAHAMLLATPRHKHASSYAADLAALAAASSSSLLPGQHGDKSVHRADSPATSGSPPSRQQQHQQSSTSSPATAVSSGSPGPQQARGEGGPHTCTTPLHNARLSWPGSSACDLAAGAASSAHQQPHSEPEPPTSPTASSLSAQHYMMETTTGRAVLDSIQAHDMTVSAALAWLRAGLQSSDPPPPPPARVPPQATPGKQHAASSHSLRKSVHSSRPCSPFACFGDRSRARSSDDTGDCSELTTANVTQLQQLQQQPQQPQHQQPEAAGPLAGVSFEMGSDNRLVMVIRQQQGDGGKVDEPQRLHVTGVRLWHAELAARHVDGMSAIQASSTGASAGGSSAAAVAGAAGIEDSSTRSLDLVTTGGCHTIELATEEDLAGLIVGLNAMLLLHEQQGGGGGAEAAEALGQMPMRQVPWSRAVRGMLC